MRTILHPVMACLAQGNANDEARVISLELLRLWLGESPGPVLHYIQVYTAASAKVCIHLRLLRILRMIDQTDYAWYSIGTHIVEVMHGQLHGLSRLPAHQAYLWVGATEVQCLSSWHASICIKASSATQLKLLKLILNHHGSACMYC